MDFMSPYFISPSDSPWVSLVPATSALTGDNYATWAKAVRRALRAKNKLGFVDDSNAWDICNNLVVSWIRNSLGKNLQTSLAYVNNALDFLD
ncbi:hypothetical protein CRG98_002438 [Punica granatum]|uniref:Retrotransposon Copia-like N-terminal domain-containing protein n=1 Tax=Punica granatum TaxID=22663 RepID=A0A2I0LAG1_PUNGR|nr:hypothetical protein CRG98_002438 [Punica granatum]